MASTLARFSHVRDSLGIPATETINRGHVGSVVRRLESSLRSAIIKSLSGTRLVEKGPASGELLLAKDFIEVIRKAPSSESSFVSYLQAIAEARLRVTLTKDVCLKIREYFTLLDLFSPSVLVGEPVEINLSKANKGALSIDFAGQNVFNLFYTADAVAFAAKRGGSSVELADLAVTTARKNDIEFATPRLNSLRENIRSVVERYGLGEVKFTGDDGMVVLQKYMNDALFETVMQDLSKYSLTGGIADYRVVYIHPMVKNGVVNGEAMRLKISAEGESAEKKFRGWSANVFSIKSTEGLGIGVKLYPNADLMAFVFVGKNAAQAETRMRREIQDGFTRSYGYGKGEVSVPKP